MNTARSMLKAKSIPNSFWEEAVTCVVYIINMCPTNILNIKILEKGWIGRKPKVNHLRIFASLCYVHVP